MEIINKIATLFAPSPRLLMNVRCLLLVAALLPVHALASGFDYLLGDAEKFADDLKWQINAEVLMIEDAEYQNSMELFIPVDDDKLINEGVKDVVIDSSKFVTVRINGIPVTFTDVPSGTWFSSFVRQAAETGIVSGYKDLSGRILGVFGPTDNVTIEQLAKIALEASGHYIPDCAGTPINESGAGSWSEDYISCTENLEWSVFSDGSVDVKRPATRSEVIITLIQSFDVSFSRGTGEVFDDVTSTTQFSGAIERAEEDGIVSGYADENGDPTGLCGPYETVNRAEIAKMITLAQSVYSN